MLLEVGLSWLGELDGSKLEAMSGQLTFEAGGEAGGSSLSSHTHGTQSE